MSYGHTGNHHAIQLILHSTPHRRSYLGGYRHRICRHCAVQHGSCGVCSSGSTALLLGH